MTIFTENCLNIIKAIPYGKVSTYGDIAKQAGNNRGARQVARILHSMSDKYDLPWHRVINSRGQISLKGEGFDIQKELLQSEGVVISSNGIVNLDIYR